MLGALCACVSWGQSPQIRLNTAGAGARAADVEAAARLICPAGKLTRAKDGSVSGCSVCPAGTDFRGDAGSSWDLFAKTPGHFAAANEENLVLSGSGCDSHASNFGGSFVFALEAGKVRLMRYDKGLITDQCLKFAFADGRDGLVCRGGWTGQGYNDESVAVVSFDATGKETEKVLTRTSDSTGTCGDDGSVTVQEAAIKDFQFTAAVGAEGNNDTSAPAKITGLTITVTVGNVSCAQVAAEEKTKTALNAVKSYTVQFGFDGKQFKVAPESRAVLAKLEANWAG